MRWLCFIVFVGCTATPLPEAPFEGDFEIDMGTGSLPFRGFEGAIDPDQRLQIWVLNDMNPPTTLVPNSDGSVAGELSLAATRLRLEVLEGDRRSPPLDLEVATTTPVRETACLEVARQLELAEGGAGTIQIVNSCDASVTAALRLRAPAAITFPLDASIAAGESLDVAISTDAAAEEILLIDFEGAANESRAVTVFTR